MLRAGYHELATTSSTTSTCVYDVFHLFWNDLRKREEKKEKVDRTKSAY
jgi:hypothetical protein